MIENEKIAKAFCDSLRKMDAEHIDKLERYLSCHFDKWLERYANTPEGLTYEMQTFSEM